ncbi:MAG: cobalamin biosynthesis protein [Rhodobacteraceae bacterium]|nr:cobalamin biosynthesis protein [Paracoccaceae bacterium]
MILALGLALDALLGEPRWLWRRVWHPVVAIGALIDWAEQQFNRPPYRRARGVLLVAVLVIGGGAAGIAIAAAGWPLEVLCVAVLLAQRALVEHVRAVAEALRLSVPEGRRAVARIVGRDSAAMDASAVACAAIESAAENISDGVVAPAFWFLVAGAPGLLIYKAINTADSMIGHRTARYGRFGWAAARLDDVLNWVPARLCAGVIALACLSMLPREARERQRMGWAPMVRDARAHRSPNAGWPEAAMAHGLDIALAGPRSYEGRWHDFPHLNARGRRDLFPADIETACRVLWRSWGLLMALALGLALL